MDFLVPLIFILWIFIRRFKFPRFFGFTFFIVVCAVTYSVSLSYDNLTFLNDWCIKINDLSNFIRWTDSIKISHVVEIPNLMFLIEWANLISLANIFHFNSLIKLFDTLELFVNDILNCGGNIINKLIRSKPINWNNIKLLIIMVIKFVFILLKAVIVVVFLIIFKIINLRLRSMVKSVNTHFIY